MQKTLDDWLAEFQSICLGGYFVDGSGAEKYRHMDKANTRLKDALRRLIDDAQGKTPAPNPVPPPPVKTPGPRPLTDPPLKGPTPPAQQPAVTRKV